MMTVKCAYKFDNGEFFTKKNEVVVIVATDTKEMSRYDIAKKKFGKLIGKEFNWENIVWGYNEQV